MSTNDNGGPVLNGRLVSLRPFVPEDAPAAHRIVGDSRVTNSLSFDEKSEEETQGMISGIISRATEENRTEYYLAVDRTGDLIGFCRLGREGVRAGQIGYAIRADEWGKGYATDAVETIVRFSIETLGLHRVTAAIGPENIASITIVRKLGFQYEGTLRDHVFTNGAWRNSLLYSIIDHEWQAREGAQAGAAGVSKHRA